MGMLTRLAEWVTRSTYSNPEQWFMEWARGGQESSSGIVVSQSEALRDVIAASCTAIRSADLAKLPVNVKRRLANGGTEILRSHAVNRVLNKPNAWQTKFEFFETMQACYLLKGNAYAPVIWNGRGQPVGLIPVNPDRVCLWANAESDLYFQVSRGSQFELSQLANLPSLIHSEDMLHLRAMSLNGVSGLSRIGMARDAIGLSLALERYSSSLFARGARPSGVLETDKKLGTAALQRFKEQWQLGYAGTGNAAKTPILEEGLKWKASTMTSVESQTVEARRLQIEQIATAFDVPLHRLGVIPEGGGQAILQAHQMYLNNTLSTDAERWENKLNDLFGLDGDEIFIEFDLDYFNRADLKTQLEALRIGVVGSVFTPNEARRKIGMPDDPKGNFLMQPANVVALGTLPAAHGTSGPGSDVTGEPAPGGDGDPAAVQTVAD